MIRAVTCCVVLAFCSAVFAKVDLSANPPEYGVDCSTPIHHEINKKECPYFFEQYKGIMQGCYNLYSKQECDNDVVGRWQQNLQQPATQHNYTDIGFKLMRAPSEIYDPILKFYRENRANKRLEKWYRGSTIVNSWSSPSYMVSFEDGSYKGGMALKQFIWKKMQPIIEEWVGHRVEPTSLYGVREYSAGSVLSTRMIYSVNNVALMEANICSFHFYRRRSPAFGQLSDH